MNDFHIEKFVIETISKMLDELHGQIELNRDLFEKNHDSIMMSIIATMQATLIHNFCDKICEQNNIEQDENYMQKYIFIFTKICMEIDQKIVQSNFHKFKINQPEVH